MPLFTLRPSAPPRLKVNPRKPVSQLETQNRALETGNHFYVSHAWPSG
jgi:hypothetical protein